MEEERPGQALPFIINKGGEFVVTPEAENFLKSLAGKQIGVVCIVGKYRTGKSYLINRVILQRTNTDGFKVGPTVNPCTKGLWIWNNTIKGTSTDGEELDLIVMDCEGFGGMDEGQNHDTRIFLFAMLLSSYFVYNSVGSIDENALQNLSLVVNLAKEVKMKASDNETSSEEEVAQNFPSFLWIVRDFSLRMVDSNDNPLTSKQYLESALALVKGCSEGVESKNRVRRLLKHFFRERDCVTMVRPVELEQDLQRLDSLPDKFLREEFLQQINMVRSKVLKKTKQKTVNGKPVTSETFLHLANGYAAAVNRGKVPTIESAWNYVCKEKANEVAKECVSMAELLVEKDEKVLALINEGKDWKAEVRSRLLNHFEKSKFADSENLKDRQAQLEKEINDKLETISKNIMYQQSGSASRWLEDHFTHIGDMINQNHLDSPRKAKQLLEELETKFHTENKKIPQKQREEIMLQFRQEKETRMLSAIVRSKEEKQRKENEAQLAHLQSLEKVAAENKLMFEEEKSKFIQKIKELEESNRVMSHQEVSLKEKLSHFQEKIEFERQKAVDRESMHKEAFDDMVRRYQGEVDNLSTRANTKDTELFKATAEKEKLEMMLEQQKKLSLDAIETMKKKISDSEIAVNQAKERETLLNEKIKMMARSEELKEAREELDTMRKKRRLLENENSELKNEKQFLDSQIKFYKDQIEDNKKLQDTLLGALQQQLKLDEDNTATELLATNKNLGTSLGKAEARIKALETKLGRYKLYKQMVVGAKAFQCKETGKLIPKNGFLAHLQYLEKSIKQGDRDSDDSIMKAPEQIVKITQTMIKECPETGRAFTEYLMHIKYSKCLWNITRTYKEFCEFNHNLSKAFPTVKLPESVNYITGFTNNVSSVLSSKKRALLEDRRLALEEYLNDLFKIPQIANSQVFKEFLKIDIYVDERGGEPQYDQSSKTPGREDTSMCDVTSVYKNIARLDPDSAAKQYSNYGSEYRRERHTRENSNLINYH
jgi:hypothetical protein